LVQIAAKPYPGFMYWTIGCVGQSAAFTLSAYAPFFPPLLVSVGANICYALFPLLLGQGLRAFAGRPVLKIPVLLALAWVAGVAYYLKVINPHLLWRVLLLMLTLLPFYLDCAWLVWREPAYRLAKIRIWLVGWFLLYVGWNLGRLAFLLVFAPDHRELWTFPGLQAVQIVIVTSVSLAVMVGVIVLNFQRASESLAQQERRLAFALSATQEAIWEWNLQTDRIYYSSRWFEILGLGGAARELTLDIWREFCHPEDLPAVLVAAHEASHATKDRPFTTEFRARHANGTWRWIRARGRLAQRDASGKPLTVSGTNTDITEERSSRERQARLEAQLHQAQKMEALGTLAGGIAHDFNNILVGIMGNVQLAAMDLPKGSPITTLLENSLQASRRARDLIARIMTFSHRHEPSHRLVALAPIVAEVAALMRATLPAQINLEHEIDPATPDVEGDPTQLHEVLMNLAVNAAGAIGEEPGVLTLTLRHGPPAPGIRARYPDLPASPQVQLAVRDTGVGMSPAVIERIFEPFFSTKEIGKGSGLGLTMVHRIVTDLHGLVTVESTPGQGTVMTVFLRPAATSRSATADTRTAPVPVMPAGTSLLVVDDDKPVLEVTAAALRRLGVTVQAHEHPAEALAALRHDPDRFSAVLTDLTMPQQSGLDLARAIRVLNPRIPIIVMTGHLTGQAQSERAKMAGLHFIQKPFELSQLLALLGAALAPPPTG
jgi:PAS domain S-box-containing protein